MKKVLLVVGLVVLALFLGKVGYEVNRSLSREAGIDVSFVFDLLRPPPSPAGLTRSIPSKIKSVLSLPPFAAKAIVKKSGAELKGMGVNTIQINTFSPNLDKRAIVEAKKQGFAVWVALDPSVAGVRFPNDYTFDSKEKWEEELAKRAVKYAQIAEEYQVEFYTPLTEPDLILANNSFLGEERNQELKLLADAVYPKVREVFKGKLIAKVTEARTPSQTPGKSDDFGSMWTSETKGADILGLDISQPENFRGSYQQMFGNSLQQVVQASKELNIPWVVAEYWQGHEVNYGESFDQRGFEAFLEETMKLNPRPSGFSINIWPTFSQDEKNKLIRETLQNFYFEL